MGIEDVVGLREGIEKMLRAIVFEWMLGICRVWIRRHEEMLTVLSGEYTGLGYLIGMVVGYLGS